jgi:hypothetical protein
VAFFKTVTSLPKEKFLSFYKRKNKKKLMKREEKRQTPSSLRSAEGKDRMFLLFGVRRLVAAFIDSDLSLLRMP